MFQFLPFMLGLMTGSVAVRAARSQRARQGLERARASARTLEHPIDGLRTAATTGLVAIEHGSARLREKIAPAAPAPAPAAPTRTPRKTPPKAAGTKPAAAKPARTRKPAASKAAPEAAKANE